MAFPKKYTRTITLASGQAFLCHFNARWMERTAFVAIREPGQHGQLLLIDPYHQDFLPSKATLRIAMRSAFRYGWQPYVPAKPLYLRYTGTTFVPGPAGCHTE